METNMFLTSRDIQLIEKRGFTREFFVSENNGWLQLKNHHGRCVFHNGNKCIIYEHRPEGCRLYPLVYDKTHEEVILDDECPQRHCFPLTKEKNSQLKRLVCLLETERIQRIRRKATKKTR